MKKIKNGGYVGILALLLGTIIMFMILWKYNPFATNKGEQNTIGQDIKAIEDAKLWRDKAEERDRQMMLEE